TVYLGHLRLWDDGALGSALAGLCPTTPNGCFRGALRAPSSLRDEPPPPRRSANAFAGAKARRVEREREETMGSLFFSPRLARASRSPKGVAGGGLQPEGLEGGTPVPPTPSSLRRRWRSQRGPELVHRRTRALKSPR